MVEGWRLNEEQRVSTLDSKQNEYDTKHTKHTFDTFELILL